MKRILISLSTIGAVAALVAVGTGAFFKDVETSTGNTFSAGAIDLKIDNESYYNAVATSSLSWQLTDLTIEKFFNYIDLKPGDDGEDTISIHVNDNDAWVCADVKLTSDNDNGCTEPESGDAQDPSCGDPGLGEGELADEIHFIWWADDGDNVLEDDERQLPGGPLGALGVGQSATVAFADSSDNIWTGQPDDPVDGGSTQYIGKAWCFGNIQAAPLRQGDYDNPGVDNNGDQVIDNLDGGFACDGSSGTNITQTDSMTADITFRAEQSRNNENFVCDLT